MDINLFSKMDDPELFKEFKIIITIQGKTIKEVSNKFVADYVAKNKKVRNRK